MNLGDLNQSQQFASQQAKTKPVTMDITDSVTSLGSQAEEIVSRLYALRDRLFGPDVTAAGGANVTGLASTSNCFADASRRGIADLRSTLDSIDRLSSEINDRL